MAKNNVELKFKTLEEYRNAPSALERMEAYTEFFSYLRQQMGRKIRQELVDKGYTAPYVADVIGCGANRLYQVLNGKAFAIPHDALVKLSSNFLNRSCHETMLGEPGITRLPKSLSLLTKTLRGYELSTQHFCLAEILNTYGRASDDSLIAELNCQQIIRERYLEISYDKGVYPPNILENLNHNLKTSFRKLLFSDTGVTLQINTLLLLTIELGTSLDYFLVQDYTRFTRLCMYDDPADIISDDVIVSFISYFLRLPPDLQAKMFAYVLNIG